MDKIQGYRHLDKEDKISFSMTDTVRKIRKLNYGDQRLLAELVKQREESEDFLKYEHFRKSTILLRTLLENGFF